MIEKLQKFKKTLRIKNLKNLETWKKIENNLNELKI